MVTNLRLVPSGYLTVQVLAQVTSLKRVDLSVVPMSSSGQTFSTISCQWLLTTTVVMQ